MKKGISPLIATVLLIGFTIVLAVIVLQWGSSFFQKTTTETGCDVDLNMQCTDYLTNLEITKAEENIAGTEIDVTVYNKATIDVNNGAKLIFKDEAGTTKCIEDSTTVIESFKSEDFTITTTNCMGAKTVEFIPSTIVSAECSGLCENIVAKADITKLT